MKVISVINYKGGVGKTTLTANLGAYAASQGKRVLLIDLDPQTHLTFNFITIEDWKKNFSAGKTLRDFFKPVISGKNDTKPLSELAIPVHAGEYDMDIVSSHLNLIDTDMELAAMIIATTPQLLAATSLKTFCYLRNALFAVKNKYDLVLIDCPPSFYVMVKNAILASDYYIVPTKLDYLSVLGIENLQGSIKNLLRLYDDYSKILEDDIYTPINIKALGAVPTMVKYLKGNELIAANKEYLQEIEDRHFYIFKSIRNNSSVFGVAPKVGVPIVLTKPKAFFQKSQKIIVDELKELGGEFLSRLF